MREKGLQVLSVVEAVLGRSRGERRGRQDEAGLTGDFTAGVSVDIVQVSMASHAQIHLTCGLEGRSGLRGQQYFFLLLPLAVCSGRAG